MQMTDTKALIADYAENSSEPAFRELVSRYVNLVYSTALRLVNGDTHLAEDVVQVVFVDLARIARTLPGEVMLGGWLHRHTCFVAAKTIRGERRRQFRERQAIEMHVLHEHSDFDFSTVAPILDQTINELGDLDRKAVLLRFFEQHDFAAIGNTIGGNEDSARMRVNRALEKLASRLKRRGVTSTAAALSAALSTNAVQVAPVGMAASVSTFALAAGTAVPAATVIAAAKTAGLTMIQKFVVAGFLAAGAGTALYQAHQVADARIEIQTLAQRQGPLTLQVRQLERERDDATNRFAAVLAENERLQSDGMEEEVLQLRNEITLLQRTDTPKPAGSIAIAAKSWLASVNRFKEYLRQNPDKTIPEFQFLAHNRWLNAIESIAPEPEAATNLNQYYSGPIYFLQVMAEGDFGGRIQMALQKYADANQGKFPTDLAQLQPYCDPEVEALLQQHYEIKPASFLPAAQAGEIKNVQWVVVRKEPAALNSTTRQAFFASGCIAWSSPPRLVNAR